MRIRHLFMAVLCAIAAITASAQSAPSAFDPPVKSAMDLQHEIHPLPQYQVANYIAHVSASQTYTVFQGQNETLKAQAEAEKSKRIKIGETVAIDLGPTDIFSDSIDAGTLHIFVGAITSIDAVSLRVRVSLAAMNPIDELYVVDPNVPRAYGPFTSETDTGEGWWLPTVQGDTAYLLARSASPTVPNIYATGLVHNFKDMETVFKELSCNNLIACEGNADLQSVSSGIGHYSFIKGVSSFVCSGALINNPDTPELEPLFLTANHCVSTQTEVASVDVFWDFRVATCNPAAAPPALNTLPQSNGQTLLATNSTIDGTLLRLDTVPSGSFGRTYIGYTTTAPAVSQAIIGIHHPQGTHMRISYGQITALNQSPPFSNYEQQIRVEWADGVTEGGSSGSPLLTNENGYKIIGMLSNGATHVCPEVPSSNFDNYASFAGFFPSITAFIGTSGTGTNPGPTPTPTPLPSPCPAKVTLENYPQLLDSLRRLRDSGLLETDLGQQLVKQYYESAPGLAEIVKESDTARSLFMLGAGAASKDED